MVAKKISQMVGFHYDEFHRMERIPKKSPGIRVLVLVKFIFQKLGPDKKYSHVLLLSLKNLK